jgi:transposase
MEEILDRCCGLDVHRDTIAACVMIGNGSQKRKEIKTFSTFTCGIQELASWLKSLAIRHVAVESTGIYWKPIFNLFEGDFFDVILVNAQHVKNVPGRKTDVKDSEWLCRLLKCGLLSKSFIPPKRIVRLRELVRYRQTLTKDLSSAKNRIIKMLENANVKLSTVFSDVFGNTAWKMICKLVAGETRMDELTNYIHPRCKSSLDDIKKALEGRLEQGDRNIIKRMMSHVRSIEKIIEEIDQDIQVHLQPYQAQVELLKTIPGVKDLAAASIIAELGVDMNQFKDAGHLSAWAGMCPGNNQSAGKIKSSRIRKGNKHLKITMTQVAWAISRTKGTYLGAKYRALAQRRGRKRAIIAIGRKTVVICYHMLKDNITFQELGKDFLDKLEPERKARYHEKRLEELGYHVKIMRKAV